MKRVEPSDAQAVLEVRDVARRFKQQKALDGVSLALQPGRIHALLGPNGAGKTTLLRILVGIVEPDAGEVLVSGHRRQDVPRQVYSGLIGFVPSGDRSFYLRISGLENLIFFARLHGLSRKEAKRLALEAMDAVGLADAAGRPVGGYSHGMQKRLSVARTILLRPRILLVDEATHDLDPSAARRVRDLVTGAAEEGTAVLWTTQRVEEIRNFADTVTLLQRGEVAFLGSVEQLLEQADLRRHLLHLQAPALSGEEIVERASAAIGEAGQISRLRGKDGEEFELIVASGRDLGEVLATLHSIGIRVLDCHSARTDVEEAFLAFTEGRR